MSYDKVPQGDWRQVLRRLDRVRWELPAEYMYGMRVPGQVYANEALMESLASDMAIQQVANVANLPGIVGRSLAMPDIHWGYGFPIGGVAATRTEDGVISPGGVGFDINCGVRLLRTALLESEIAGRLTTFLDQCFRDIPVGAGKGAIYKLGKEEEDSILSQGAAWLVRQGWGTQADLEVTESGGALRGADPLQVSQHARERGRGQLGSLGSGNHFVEVQAIDAILDPVAAQAFGLREVGQVCGMIHTGSRGLGHQICQDFLGRMQSAMHRYGIQVPDRQLACVPVRSPEGTEYLGAMAAGANFAWANRQAMIQLVYDVSHNMAKIERHSVEGIETELCVHRKGATRAFPAGHPEVPAQYREVGQPVLVPGDMGRYSFVLVGQPQAMQETWGSSCHGAGRLLSRGAAKRALAGVDIAARLRERGIMVRAQSQSGLAEEATEAYKDAKDVVETLQEAGVARIVARLRPLGVIKG
ncbi:MAG: RtcB family protein [Dehalococcoidia bacterium]